MDRNNSIANNIRLGTAPDSARWVDERLAFLTPHETWSPDVRVAQGRLRQRLSAPKHNWSRMIGWYGAIFAAAVIIAVALTSAPAPRVLAQRCIDCSIAVWQAISPATGSSAKLDPVSQRPPAKDFELKDATGAIIRPSDLKGKVVVLNFWATWCGGCQVEIPWLAEFYEKYEGAGLEVIGVSLDSDGWKSVGPYLKERAIPYKIVIGSETTAKEFNVTAMPVTILIDREGRVAATNVGVPLKSTYEADIQALLK
jgi:cytochrome c biogenesis protein CcmG/thiol:disulfide interchange protein DsbE